MPARRSSLPASVALPWHPAKLHDGTKIFCSMNARSECMVASMHGCDVVLTTHGRPFVPLPASAPWTDVS